MATSVSDLPEYQTSAAKYQADKRQAEQAGDAAALERIEFGWERAQFGMQKQLDEQQRTQQRHEAALEQIKRDHPDVPTEVYEHIGDPQVALETAKKVDAAIKAKTAPGGQTWSGAPGTSSDTSQGQPTEVPYDDFVKEQVQRAQRGDKLAAEQVFDAAVEYKLTPLVSKER